MKKFLDENFLLQTDTAQRLYHEFAASLPVIDYHCHLPPQEIAEDINFTNLAHAWLYGDHYKWRAMRSNGVDESYCTGNKPDREKFQQWAATVPYTVRNPLYHWTHLELQRYFEVNDILNSDTADKIYDHCTELLQSGEYSVRNLLTKMKVEVVCTTDDPVDSLEYHKKIKEDNFSVKVLPAFRPDKAMNVDDATVFNAYVGKLEAASNMAIASYTDFVYALKKRHDFFGSMGCSVSDHGLEHAYAEEYTDAEIKKIFESIRTGQSPSLQENWKFKTALLTIFGEWDREKSWVQQYHLGAMRNNNSRMLNQLGPDTGWDSIGDFQHGHHLAKFLDRLDSNDKLAKTILYNLNPADNALFASMTGNFNDGSLAGKVQYGAAWWFLDQKDGIISQLNALSNMGLLSRFVGMITDSRSFLSYPRHEYFRRILCNIFGAEIENGEIPSDIPWIGNIIRNICYYNARRYFGW